MDKLTIFLPAGRQFKLAVVIGSLWLLVAACASTGQGNDAGASETEAASDAQMHIATAERLADVGEYESALQEYLAAARVSSDPEIAQMVARLAARLENWSTAVTAAERWLELDPDAESANHVRVIGLVNQQETGRAVSALTTWLDRDHAPDSPRWWRRGAIMLAATSADETARAVFDRLERERGEQAPEGEVAHARSILLWRQGDHDASMEQGIAAAESSNEADHLVWAAQLASDDDRYEQALDLYRRARESEPDNVTLALSEAEVLRQLERHDEALELLRSMPADSETLYTLGVYLFQLDRKAKAEAAWEQLRDLPDDRQRGDHTYLVAQLAELVGRDEAALAWFGKVDDPAREDNASMRRAVILGRLDRVEEGRAILAGLREVGDANQSLDTWLIEAEMLRQADRASEAVELLAAPLAENPGSVDLLYGRALSAASAGNVDLAEQDLRRIIQMDGDNAMALNALGYTLTDQTDRHEEAYRLIQRALELDPDDPATLDSMGWVLHRLGRSEDAVDFLRRALEGDANAEIMAHLIEVLDETGRAAEAEELAQRALAEHPDDRYLRETLSRLDRLP